MGGQSAVSIKSQLEGFMSEGCRASDAQLRTPADARGDGPGGPLLRLAAALSDPRDEAAASRARDSATERYCTIVSF